MTETKRATGGFGRITRLPPTVNVRLVAFALAVGLGVLLILWLQAGVAGQMRTLELEFAALKAETFSVAVQMRVQFRNLSFLLLDLSTNRKATDPEVYQAEALQLRDWLIRGRSSLLTDEERRLCDQVLSAYDAYGTNVQRLLDAHDGQIPRATFADTFDQVRELGRPVMDAIAQLVRAQQAAFDMFLRDARLSLNKLDRLLNLSLALLLVAGALLAVLLYRGMITPLRRRLTESESIIARQEKLAALGTLAAGVAHEIRNPLTAIKFRLFSFKKALPPEFAEHEDAGVISAEINRLDRIVKDFLQFARPSDPEAVRVPAERILQEVHHLLSPQLEKTAIQLRLEATGTTWVHADTQQLKQVLINLIQNAADSIGRNGSIHLRVRPDRAELAGREQSVAVLQVADTGKGIPPDVEKRLFDPFFSTKEGGTGLGLAIAERIVEKHGGLLRYHTQEHHGTTFEVVLPRLEDHAS